MDLYLYLYLLYPTAVDGSSDMERSVIDFAQASHRHWTVILLGYFAFQQVSDFTSQKRPFIIRMSLIHTRFILEIM